MWKLNVSELILEIEWPEQISILKEGKKKSLLDKN